MASTWTSLPLAIRILILNNIAREAAFDHTLTQYVAVSRDWQYFFEQLTFRSLCLGPDDLPEFDRILWGTRRRWLRRLSFGVQGEAPITASLFTGYRKQQPIGTHTALNLSKFYRLQELCIQVPDACQALEAHDQTRCHQEVATLIPGLPASLKRLHILGIGGDDPTRVCRSVVRRSAWLAFMVTPVEELSVTTSRNAAEEFFEPLPVLRGGLIVGEFHWPGLQSLTLACSLLRPEASHPEVNRFLHKAGISALHMPELRRLQMYSRDTFANKDEVDGFFQYFVDAC
ncbi:hypothetical protein VMCG_02058 [Cytospora schulzeri]|uniref:DUF6546 domain-containing protein n=1 Tax=Cytospora schulzeri TaxID=448051 RepID=A0A423X2Y4_9PEZI|nr:hypothetical protein VMCG_02058 [Valsa malicola]